MTKGWIAIHREIQKNWLWEEKPFSKGQAWIDLLMLANYKDHKQPYKGEIITCKKGTVNSSISALANRWGWSRDKARRFLDTLASDEMVRVNATVHRTTITIENYALYNDVPTTDRQQIDSKPTASRQQVDTTNKDNKDKPLLYNNNIGRFKPPTLEAVAEYCLKRQNGIDPEAFVDYYESKGWYVGKSKMKDWKAAVRNWERRQKPPKLKVNQDMTDLDDLF